MIKLVIAGRHASGITRREAHRHLRDVHGPLVYDAPGDAGPMPVRYVQNHVFDGPDVPALVDWRSDRDLVTEVWFDDLAQIGRATSTPYYKTVLQPDEPRFVDDATVLKGAMREGALTGTIPAEAAKVFAFLKRADGIAAADFAPDCAAAVEAVRGEAAASLVNAALPPPGGGEPYADQVAELWFETRSEATRFCERVLPGLFLSLARKLAGSSFYLLADEYDVVRLKATRDVAA